MQTVHAFLEKWKPFATLPPGNPVRRSIVRLLETDDPGKRESILSKASDLYRLHRTYEALNILRDGGGAKGETLRRLLAISGPEFAEAIRKHEQKPFLQLLQEGFEFGRVEVPASQHAARQFLLTLWSLKEGAPAIKYSIYPNGVLFTAGGLTHDAMTREFKKLGFGGGNPMGGGFLARRGELAFAYDTHSDAVRSSAEAKPFVKESLKRAIRTTGGDPEQVAIAYEDKVA